MTHRHATLTLRIFLWCPLAQKQPNYSNLPIRMTLLITSICIARATPIAQFLLIPQNFQINVARLYNKETRFLNIIRQIKTKDNNNKKLN